MTENSAALFAGYAELTRGLSAPVGLLDADALEANAADMVRRARGTPIRLATKSIRCLPLIDWLLARPGIRGVLTLTLAESLWLHRKGVEDVVLGYPTADRPGLRALGQCDDPELPVVLMVDSLEQAEFLVEHVQPSRLRPLRVCLELDASLRIGARMHVGPRRSPVHTPAELVHLAERLSRRPDVRIEGLMAYEGQIAGIADGGRGIHASTVRVMQAASRRELAERRAAAVAALRGVADLRFVNGGGTGSIESTTAEPSITEVGAGSGFLSPALFDNYRAFTGRPAIYIGLDVVRRPGPGTIAVLGGGWVASGPAGVDRYPTVAWPPGLEYVPLEGPGEAQTPLRGPAADRLRIGDRVWLRHAKAGEVNEHLNELQVCRFGSIVASWPTYRGAGLAIL